MNRETYEKLNEHLPGEVVPLPTLFNDDLSINFSGVGRHLEFLLDSGVKIIYLAQAASEFEWLSSEERLEVVAFVAKELGGKAMLLAQPVNHEVRALHIEEGIRMREAGADALVVWPINVKYGGAYFSSKYLGGKYIPDRHNKYYISYVEEFAEKSKAPIFYHNKPFSTGDSIALDALKQISEVDNVVGIKEHSTDPGYRHKVYEMLGNTLPCFDGFGKTSQMWSLLWGAKGRHTCWSWFDPISDQIFTSSVINGQIQRAAAIARREWPITKAIIETGLAGYKRIMELSGLPGGPVRIPGQGIDTHGVNLVDRAFEEYSRLVDSGCP